MVEKNLLMPEMDPRFAPSEVTKGELAAWVGLGAVVYIRGSLEPAWPALLNLWDFLWSSDFASEFTHARFWDELEWRPRDKGSPELWRDRVRSTAGKRPFWKVEIGNRPVAPDLSFEFADLHPTLGRERASYVRLRFPLSFPAQRLFDVTHRIMDLLPVWHGTSGYLFHVLEAERDLAYDQVWAWAKRYWGVQVIDTRSGTWDALRGLSGINWLTLLGRGFLEQKKLSLEEGIADPLLAVHQAAAGTILQAGSRPLLGDLNSFEDVAPYAAASRMVQAAYVNKPVSFPGMFTDQESTLLWIRRFDEPAQWVDPELV